MSLYDWFHSMTQKLNCLAYDAIALKDYLDNSPLMTYNLNKYV